MGCKQQRSHHAPPVWCGLKESAICQSLKNPSTNFVKAGIQTDDPRFKYFLKGYDGELTPEAIRRAAEEAQLITPQVNVVDQDKQAWQQSNKIAAGSESAPPGPSWAKRIQDAQSEQEVYAIFAEAQAQGIEL